MSIAKVYQAPNVCIHVNLVQHQLEVIWKDVIDEESLANAHSILRAIIAEHQLKKYYANIVNALLSLELEAQIASHAADYNVLYACGIRYFAMHARSKEQIILREPLLAAVVPGDAQIYWTLDEADALAWLASRDAFTH